MTNADAARVLRVLDEMQAGVRLVASCTDEVLASAEQLEAVRHTRGGEAWSMPDLRRARRARLLRELRHARRVRPSALLCLVWLVSLACPKRGMAQPRE